MQGLGGRGREVRGPGEWEACVRPHFSLDGRAWEGEESGSGCQCLAAAALACLPPSLSPYTTACMHACMQIDHKLEAFMRQGKHQRPDPRVMQTRLRVRVQEEL